MFFFDYFYCFPQENRYPLTYDVDWDRISLFYGIRLPVEIDYILRNHSHFLLAPPPPLCNSKCLIFTAFSGRIVSVHFKPISYCLLTQLI
jgi:hypothetical protein